jgi:hypothetical protein
LRFARRSGAGQDSNFDDTEDTMQILDWITCRRVERKESASFFCLVLLYMFTHAVALAEQPGVQAASTPFESTTLGAPAHDVAMAGTVQELTTTHTQGAPVGLQLVVEGPQGTFTASLGSILSDQVRQTLSTGAPVQVSGVMETINGKSYLLARKLTVAGDQVIIRNDHGFLVHSQQRSHASVNNSALSRGAK